MPSRIHPPPKKKRRKTNWMHQADTAFSKWVRSRDGECQADPPHAGYLQCAHIHTRSYKSIRTHPDNATTLCAKHHVFYTHRPLEWNNWVEARWPGRWDELKTQALKYERVLWKDEAAFWKEQL